MILHISNAFLGSKVHRNLYSSLDNESIPQIIYSVIRSYKKPKKENFINFQVEGSQIVLAKTTLKTYHRFLFRSKILSLYKDLITQVDLNQIGVVHATTLFTDGAIALKIFKEFKKPYVVTVRNTDINYFFKYRPDLRGVADEILSCAQKVTFISPALKESFLSHKFVRPIRSSLEAKSVIIYNGIEDFWIDKKVASINPVDIPSPHKILFVGRISREKNLSRLIKATVSLNRAYPTLSLTLIGPWGNDGKNIKRLLSRYSGVVNYHGEIKDKEKLLQAYRAHHIFAMPSTKETFGLVYLEALTQNLPVLYTKGQGFDGVLNEHVGEAVKSDDEGDIERGVEAIIANYKDYRPDSINFEQFRWQLIAKSYTRLYSFIRGKNSNEHNCL